MLASPQSPIVLRLRATTAIPSLGLAVGQERDYQFPIDDYPDITPDIMREIADNLRYGTFEVLPPVPTCEQLLAHCEWMRSKIVPS
jgi:hypothetical protein